MTALMLAPSVPRPPRRDRIPSVIGRAVVGLSLLGFAMIVAVIRYVEVSMPVGGDPWMVGDWLINYGGGFVRRGLFGDLFLQYAPGGSAGLWLLFMIQLAIYSTILAYCVSVLHRSRYSWSSIALVCGPAGLAFIGWVPSIDAAFRKELLPLLVLLILAVARGRGHRLPVVVVLILAALALFFLAVFSWEASALLLPAVGYLLWARGAPHPGLDVFRRSAAAVFAAIGGIGAILSALIHGDVATAAAVCEKVRANGFSGPILCSGGVEASGGAIEAIGWTSYKTTQDLLIAAPVYAGFVVLIVLSFVPVVTSRWFRAHWKWALLIFLGVAPLYFVVTDYGRWTHIIYMALLFCITASDPTDSESRLWNGPGAVMYTTLWGMPHWMGEAQLGETWWPFVGALPKAIETAMDRLAAAGGQVGYSADAVIQDTTLEYAWRFLRGMPSNGVDSWFPMGVALRYIHEGGTDLYQHVFFEGAVKFQYAPTSLLFVELPHLFWPSDFAWAMNTLGWLAVVLTAFGVFRILQHLVARSWAPQHSSTTRTVVLLTVSAVATVTFYPIVRAWDLGQLQVFINLICVWALYAYLRGNSALAGVALAIAVLMKPQLGLFLLWGLARRDWRFVASGVGTGLIGGLASLFVYGWGDHLGYLRVLSFLSRHGEVYYPNQSVNGLLQRIFLTGDPLVFDMFGFPGYHPTVFFWTMFATVAFTLIALVVAFLRPGPADPTGQDAPALDLAADLRALDFSIALLCFTLASPIAWEHHYGVLLPVFAIAILLALRQARPVAVTLVVILAASYLMIGNLWQPLLPTYGPGMIFLSHMLFGAVLLLICLLVLRWLLTSEPSDAAGDLRRPSWRWSAARGRRRTSAPGR